MAFAFAICLAGSFTLWEQSLKIRAYPLNTCFAIGIIWLTMLWRKDHDRRILFILALLMGIGMANHEILLVVGAVPFVAMVADFKKLRVVDVLAACGLGLLGLTVYAYLPIRAAADPVLNWGDPRVDLVLFSKELINFITFKGMDFASLENLRDALFQKQYSHKMMTSPLDQKILMTGVILKAMVTEFGPVTAVIGVIGLPFAFKRDMVLAMGLLLLVLLNIAIRTSYIGDYEFHQVLRYMISSFVAFLIFAAFFADLVVRAVEKSRLSDFLKYFIAASLAVAIAIFPVMANSGKNDLSSHRIGYDYIQSVLMFPETGYVLTANGDNTVFPLWYLQRFERFREDVVVMTTMTFFPRAQWLAREVEEKLPSGTTEPRARYIDLRSSQRFFSTIDHLAWLGYPVYSLFDVFDNNPAATAAMMDLKERFGLNHCAMAFRFGDRAPHCDHESYLWDLYPLDLMPNPKLYRDFHTTTLMDKASHMITLRGHDFVIAKKATEAINCYNLATMISPEDQMAWVGLANALARAGQAELSLEIYDRLVEKNPDDPVFQKNRDLILRVMQTRVTKDK